MFAKFDEIPAMTFKILRKHNVTDGRENSKTKFAGGIMKILQRGYYIICLIQDYEAHFL